MIDFIRQCLQTWIEWAVGAVAITLLFVAFGLLGGVVIYCIEVITKRR